MFIKKIPVGRLSTNCYIVADDSRQGIIIDPGDNADLILDIARTNSIQINAIWLTHGHFDHILGIPEIQDTTQASLFISQKDEESLSDPKKNLLSYIMPDYAITLHADKTLNDGDVIYAGSIPFTVIETPGHTPGSICFMSKEEMVLFSGDTLFSNGGYGRTDLVDGNEQTMQTSLKNLAKIKEPFHVYPGHGDDFILGDDL